MAPVYFLLGIVLLVGCIWREQIEYRERLRRLNAERGRRNNQTRNAEGGTRNAEIKP